MMRVLVIGASGLVGSAALHAFKQAGHEVTGTYRRHQAADLVYLDLSVSQSIRDLVDRVAPEVVLIPAALTNLEYCEGHPEETYAANVTNVRRVVDACADVQPLIVYYSTDYIFDGRDGPYAEESEPRPLNVYGHSKLAAERVVQDYARHLIVRTTVVFGWRRDSMNFAMQLLRTLAAGKTMRVPDDQVGNPTLAHYLGDVTVRLVEAEAHGVVNVSGRDRLDRYTFALELARALGLDENLLIPTSTAALGQRAVRPLNGGFALDTLRALLGAEPMPLAQALTHFRRQRRADSAPL